jgi:hypothetical protein
MSKSPSFNFYSADFLVGVMDLTDEETGQYIKLICLQHQKGRLKKESIYRMFPNISDSVLEKFEIDENGCYYHKRLEAETTKKQAYVESRIKNLSNSKRANPHMESHMDNHTENHMEIEIENENINNNDIDIDNNLYFQMFNEFWDIYPKKKDKDRAQKAFMRIKPNEELFAQMKCALDKHKRSAQWQDTQYIPYPATWLNGRRWEDEIEVDESSFDTDEFFQDALKRSYGK